jgi:hypothetical protein
MAVRIDIVVWFMTPCSVVGGNKISKEYTASTF